jgi:hypothetical protein
MSRRAVETSAPPAIPGWTKLLRKEAVWIGLGTVVVGYALFAGGSRIAWLAVYPPKWSVLSQLAGHFQVNAARYLAQFATLLVLLGIAASFIAGFIVVDALSLLVFAAGAWERALYYNIEPPLIALRGGLLIANLIGPPRWLDAGFRIEFYIKTGIVLLGATLPFTLILWAGPVAILQASIVSITTFLVIFVTGRRLGLDRRLAATLGAGGAVCSVSAAIAITGAVRAKKEYSPIAITWLFGWS